MFWSEIPVIWTARAVPQNAVREIEIATTSRLVRRQLDRRLPVERLTTAGVESSKSARASAIARSRHRMIDGLPYPPVAEYIERLARKSNRCTYST